MLDVAGPLQVLHGAGEYRITLGSPTGGPVITDTGVELGASVALSRVMGRLDLLVVPGYSPRESRPGADVVDQVRRLASAAGRVAGVCSGAFLLADAGILAGRRATTHWALCDELAAAFPDVSVEPDAIYVRDGAVATSAGMTAGIDLMLSLVAEDLGPDVARTVARWLVMFLQRPDGQSQFSVRARVEVPRSTSLGKVLDAVATDPACNHTLEAMAERVAVTPRHLSRLFRQELSSTPAEYVQRIRLETARALLEDGDADLDSVARRAGFGSGETLRRTFLKVLGTTPNAYRQRFRAPRQRHPH